MIYDMTKSFHMPQQEGTKEREKNNNNTNKRIEGT